MARPTPRPAPVTTCDRTMPVIMPSGELLRASSAQTKPNTGGKASTTVHAQAA